MKKPNGRRPRNSVPLTFGKAVDMLEAILADEDKERERALIALQERQALRRLAVLDRCDAETKSKVIKYLTPGTDDE